MRTRILVPILIALLPVMLLYHWSTSNAIHWPYLLRPAVVSIAAVTTTDHHLLSSPCQTISIELELLTIQLSGTTVQGKVHQHFLPDYTLRDIQLALITTPPPGSLSRPRSTVASVRWIYTEHGLRATWFFPHKTTNLALGDEIQLAISSFHLTTALDITHDIPVPELTPPLSLPIDATGELLIHHIALNSPQGTVIVHHTPPPHIIPLLSYGASFRWQLGAIVDDQNQRYGPHGGSGTTVNGIWVDTITTSPIATDNIRFLTFTVHGAELSWYRLDGDDVSSLKLRLPNKIL